MCAYRHLECGVAMEVTLSEAKMLLESLSRLIEDRTITGSQPVYNFRECVNAGRIVKRG